MTTNPTLGIRDKLLQEQGYRQQAEQRADALQAENERLTRERDWLTADNEQLRVFADIEGQVARAERAESQLAALHTRIDALVEKWRKQSEREGKFSAPLGGRAIARGVSGLLSNCADELAALKRGQ